MKVDYLLEQGSGKTNEDSCFTSGDLFGVFDGATCLHGKTFENGKTGGHLASNVAGTIFKNNNAPLLTLARKANIAIKDTMLRNDVNITDRSSLWSTSAAVVRIYKDHFEWVQTGDSLILVIYRDGTYGILTSNFDHDLETLKQWKKISHESEESIMTALKNQILKVRSQMNISYGVLNGEDEAMEFLQQGTKELQEIKTILLFTDGLFIPTEDPVQKNNFDTFVHIYQEKGLSGIRDYIRALEKKDQNCRIYPRFKTHDDIAAISLTF